MLFLYPSNNCKIIFEWKVLKYQKRKNEGREGREGNKEGKTSKPYKVMPVFAMTICHI
jgi:hypothetical protein